MPDTAGGNAGGLYEFSGVSQPEVSFELKANSVKTVARGERRARFHDGGEIQIDYPIYYMRGESAAKSPDSNTATRSSRCGLHVC